MKIPIFALSMSAGLGACLFGAVATAQAPARRTPPPRIEANLLQLMRGILYPSSNVVFASPGVTGVSVYFHCASRTVAQGWLPGQPSVRKLVRQAGCVSSTGRCPLRGRPCRCRAVRDTAS